MTAEEFFEQKELIREHHIKEVTAKLAKLKGFDVPVYYHYTSNPVNDMMIFCEPDDPQMGQGWVLENYNSDRFLFNKYSAPTQTMLQKWLREVHNIHVSVNYNGDTNEDFDYNYNVLYFKGESKKIYQNAKRIDSQAGCNTYEESLEFGLQVGLALLPTIPLETLSMRVIDFSENTTDDERLNESQNLS